MKKVLWVLMGCCFLAQAYALPLGNPAEAQLYKCNAFCTSFIPDGIGVRFGYYGDFVFNRKMQLTDLGETIYLEHVNLTTNAGYVVVNIVNSVDIFATLGATSLTFDTNVSEFIQVPGLGRVIDEFSTSFSYSVGARGVLWSCAGTSLGIEGQYFFAQPLFQRSLIFDTLAFSPQDQIRFIYREWQVGLGLAHQIGCFVPYVGGKWSRVRGEISPVMDQNLSSRGQWGYVAGVSISGCHAIGATVEGRWGDETALYVNGQIRF